MNFSKITLGLFVILCTFSVQAKMYKCSDTKGNVSYSSSPCQGDQREDQAGSTKKLQEEVDYYSRPETKEKLAREAQIVAERRSVGSSNAIEEMISRIQEASRNNDQTTVKVLSGQLKAMNAIEAIKAGGYNGGTEELNEMKNKMQAQTSQMEVQLQNQKVQMENQQRIQMHRIENQQRLNQAFPPNWNR